LGVFKAVARGLFIGQPDLVARHPRDVVKFVAQLLYKGGIRVGEARYIAAAVRIGDGVE
jgi:hypothetical protein